MDDLIHTVEHSFHLPASIVLAILAGIFSFMGIVLAVLNTGLAKRYGHFAAIVAGLLLSIIAIIHLIPESLHFGGIGGGLLILGLMTGWFLDKVGSATQNQSANVTLTPLIAIGLHSFLDGMTYVASIGHSHEAGLFTGFGLILHEIPEGIITYILCMLLIGTSFRATMVAILIASLTTPLGAVIAQSLKNLLDDSFIAIAFPITAGLVSWAGIRLLSENVSFKKKKTE